MDETKVFNVFLEKEGEQLENQLEILAEISQEFAESLEIHKTLQTTTERIKHYLAAEAASVFLLEDNGKKLVCHASSGPINITGLELDADQGIVGKTVATGHSQIVRDAKCDPDFSGVVDEATGFSTCSILCAPLSVKKESLGAIEVINKLSNDGLFDTQDKHLLTALASSASLAIHNAKMATELIRQERILKELELARKIQQGLLPRTSQPSFPIIGVNVPAYEVSGDFYDYFILKDGRIGFSLGDVSGKGITAALLMAKTSSLYHCLGKTIDSPSKLLELINYEICEKATRGMFVTMVVGLYDPFTSRIVLANAGHQPPLYRDADGYFTSFEAEAPPLGVLPDIVFPEHEISLENGSFYVYSDGLSEGMLERGDFDGLKHIETLIDRWMGTPPKARIQAIVGEVVNDSKRHDDVTLLLIEAGDGCK